MKIKLKQNIPSQDGYFLVKFISEGGLHLVLIQTNLDGSRVLIPDSGGKQILMPLNKVFENYLFSEKIEIE